MSELIKHFGVDWKLLLAQAVNFLVLLVVLKKFAYGPILRILRKRREEIQKGLVFTKKAEEEWRRADLRKQEIVEEAREEALHIVTDADTAGKKQRDELIVAGARKGEMMVVEAQRAIEQEKAKMGETVYREAQELVRLSMIKVLGKLSSKERDEILIEEALRELRGVSLRAK